MLPNNYHSDIRVLVADDHTLLVDLVIAHLDGEGGFQTDRAESLDATLERLSDGGPFEMILLDLDMPGMQGLNGVERVVYASQGCNVVLFSGQARHEAVFRALEMGVRGFIPKTISVKSLANAIRFVMSGEIYLPTSMAAGTLARRRRALDGLLTTKETDVLRGICAGQTNKEIARELGLTEITVKMHVRSICAKLNVTNRTQIAMTAMTRGLV